MFDLLGDGVAIKDVRICAFTSACPIREFIIILWTTPLNSAFLGHEQSNNVMNSNVCSVIEC